MDQIVEYSQEIVDRFIKSMGYDPRHIDNNKRMAFTKTNRFKQFAQRFGEETVVEMDKSQDPPGRDDPYDYGKGKWTRAKAVPAKKATKIAHDILKKSFDDTEKKKEMSKTAKVVKEMFKSVREELYDKEKDDKEPATYGKKPKLDKNEEDEIGDNKSQARAVLSGGTTLTGQKRDVVEFDPAMKRSKPGALNADVGGNKQ